VIIEGVDPRDAQWEEDSPTYQVYFWYQPPAPPGIPQDRVMYHATEHRLRDATDVHAVIAWAEENAGPDRTYTLYVEHTDSEGLGLVHLAGTDPTVVD
jgi:hypothetical protein